MTEETALSLIEALNRHSAAVERLTGLGSLGGGINVYHQGLPQNMQQPYHSPNEWRPIGELR